MPKVEFAGQSARDADNPAGNPSRLVNAYREPMVPGGRSGGVLRAVPGMADFAEVNAVFVRAMSEFSGAIMAIVGESLYRAVPADGGGLWTVIQAFDRAVFTNPLADIPALVRKAKVPGLIEPWVQPIDQFDAYWTKNAFTGQPDRVTHNGRIWRSVVAEATPNVWAPGTAGIWADEGPAP